MAGVWVQLTISTHMEPKKQDIQRLIAAGHMTHVRVSAPPVASHTETRPVPVMIEYQLSDAYGAGWKPQFECRMPAVIKDLIPTWQYGRGEDMTVRLQCAAWKKALIVSRFGYDLETRKH